MGAKIDRTFQVVLRETVVEEKKERFAGGHPGLYGAILVAASMVAWQWIGPWAAIGLGVGLTLMRAALVTTPPKRTPVTRKMRVEISAEGIQRVGERFIAREEIAQAYFQPRGEGPTVRCVDRHHAVLFEAEVEDEDEGREILAVLGQDARVARSEFRVAAPHLNGVMGSATSLLLGLGLFVLAAVAGGRSGWAAGGPVLGVLVAFVASLNVPQRVEVGVDGVLVRWLGRERFVPFERLDGVEQKPRCVELHLREGEVVVLWTRSARQPQQEAELEMGALAARIREASRAHAQSSGSFFAVSAVVRGQRAVAEWRAELERLHDPDTRGGYRTQGARSEDLWRVVEDTTAPEDARAGAAMALRKEDGAHPRLRVAAEAVASPKLRIALERAADPEAEDAALDEALEAFGEEKA